MSELSGNLVDFPLTAVIRLLADESKTGILVIQGPRLDGSIFFDNGELSYATTHTNHSNAAETDDNRREQDSTEHDSMIVDVTTRLCRQGGGSFTFQADVHPVHAVETSYSADHVLKSVDIQLERWLDLEAVLGSTQQPYIMAMDLPRAEEIELNGEQWNVIAALGAGQSVNDLAAGMKLSEVAIAEIVVILKNDGLIQAAESEPERARADGRTTDGDRLLAREPDLIISLTDTALHSRTVRPQREAPASELAARWRELRAGSHPEVPESG